MQIFNLFISRIFSASTKTKPGTEAIFSILINVNETESTVVFGIKVFIKACV